MTPSQNTIAGRLAEYTLALRYESLPREVIEKAKLCILDQLGVQLRGATLPVVQPIYQLVRSLGGKSESTVVFRGDRTAPAFAAYVNAAFGASCEFDDFIWGAGHPGCVTIPTALALGEVLHSTGEEIIASIVAGYEVMPRIARLIFRKLLEKGWHPTSVVGVFGATATAVNLLRLSSKQAEHAFAIAGSHASGTTEYDQSGGEVKRLHGSLAARAGIEAALLARDGMTGPVTFFEGIHGFYRLFGGTDPKELDLAWEQRYYILSTLFKLYPAVGSVLGALDALRDLRSSQQFDQADVERIDVWLADWAVDHCGTIYRPTDTIAAQFSLAYSVALYLRTGENQLGSYMDPSSWTDPSILELGDRVKAHPMKIQDSAHENSTVVEISLKGGRKLRATSEFFHGHPLNPAQPRELQAKFSSLVEGVLPSDRASLLKENVESFDQVHDVARFMTLLVPA